MSKANYRRCVAMGLTGRNTDTCFVASNDQLLPRQNVSPEFYKKYAKFMLHLTKLPKRQINPEMKKLYDSFAVDLRLDSSEDFSFERVSSLRELVACLRHYTRHGFACSVDVEVSAHERVYEKDTHSLGIEPLEDTYEIVRLHSTHIPRELLKVVHVEEIFEAINYPNEDFRVRYPFNEANFCAIPKL